MNPAVMFSGGWDSAAAALWAFDRFPRVDLVFYRYNQTYMENEYKAALRFADRFSQPLLIADLNLIHDQPRRNLHFIADLHRRGYRHLISGSRNILPIFDRYRDSNWVTLKLVAHSFGVRIDLPVVGQSKKAIVNKVRQNCDFAMYNCYSNSTELSTCNCVNCTEIKHLL